MITSALVALAAAPAFGATVTRAPTISGKAVRGSEMTASTGDWAPAGARAGYDWLRCNATGAGCRPISGSCDRRYTVRDPDDRPGATIEIRVTQPKKIGRYTRVKTRRGKAPLRVDRCLMSGSTRPVRCPTG